MKSHTAEATPTEFPRQLGRHQQIADLFSAPRTTVYGHLNGTSMASARPFTANRRAPAHQPAEISHAGGGSLRKWRLVTRFLPAPQIAVAVLKRSRPLNASALRDQAGGMARRPSLV